ncbi:MAG: GNAT family N-acetyltransferase [Desulfobulbaceae bacterium]|nr:GNAT family N-acetyltransferase [Desulfobulbaceae bacterium]
MTDVQILFISAPSPAQLRSIVALYRQAGWWPEQEAEDHVLLARLVEQSYCFAVAMSGEEIIGMGRAISDGVSDAYVQDVTVASAWRRLGVGKRIVSSILERLQGGGIAWIGLIAERGSAPFYSQLGFEKMVDSQPMLLTK